MTSDHPDSSDAPSGTAAELPSSGALIEMLGGLLASEGWSAERVTVAERMPSPYLSSFPCEVVRCRREDGAERSLFCKYSHPGDFQDPWHRAHGHRRGVAYEAKVYRSILEPLTISTPRLYGAPVCSEGRTWLVLEHLDPDEFVHRDPMLTVEAARWLGRFHALSQDRLPHAPFLSVYDAAYYRGWGNRMLGHAARFDDDLDWLKRLVTSFEKGIALLLAAMPAVIHGEFYSSNILVRDGVLYPVDWESAAIAAGEIDLASITEDWTPDVVDQAKEVYQRERWPEGAPHAFDQTFDVARLYMTLRWAGEARTWSTPEARAYYHRQLRASAERLGVA